MVPAATAPEPGGSTPTAPATRPDFVNCCAVAPLRSEFAWPAILSSWGGPGPGYQWPPSMHGITVDGKDNVWLPTNQGHQMLKFTRQGKFLMQIGREGQSKGNTDTANLNRAAEAEVDLGANEVYVADGYGNRRAIVFDPDTGAYKRHWGAYGKSPTTPIRARTSVVPLPQDSAPCIARRSPTTASSTCATARTTASGVPERRHLRQGKADSEGHARRRRGVRHRVLEGHGAAHASWPTAPTIACGRCSRSAAGHQPFRPGGRYPGQFYSVHNSRSIPRATCTRWKHTRASACRSSTTRALARCRDHELAVGGSGCWMCRWAPDWVRRFPFFRDYTWPTETNIIDQFLEMPRPR